jgi:hypothetical protein
MEPDDLLCSRNARPQKALVGRAQWKINQPPSLRDNGRAWREHLFRSMRALEDQPGYPVKRDMIEVGGRGLGMCSFDARSEGQPGHSLLREDLALFQRECPPHLRCCKQRLEVSICAEA